MKKLILISLGVIGATFIVLLVYAIYLSFNVIRPTAIAIDTNLLKKYSKLVYVPEGVRPFLSYGETVYNWEMETPQKEVVRVFFKYTPNYNKGNQNMTAVLEMDEHGDPSIFEKTLPAVIADQKSLMSAQNQQTPDLSANSEAGYKQISLLTSKTGKVVKITWDFSKDDLDEETKTHYNKLGKYPPKLLSFLYEIPNFIIGIFSA